MKYGIKIGLVSCVFVIWLILMFSLSSANGTETLKDSSFFAEPFAKILYGAPTFAQVLAVNIAMRKLAHVFLYGILGGIAFLFANLILARKSLILQGMVTIFFCTIVAFGDELHKIPIAGRHFDLGESFLNMGSSVVVILLFALFQFWKNKKISKNS